MKNSMFAPGELNKIAQDSADKTNKFFEDKIKSLTTVSDDVIKEICPKEGDKEKLVLLLEGLNKATTLEDKKNHIINNIGTVGEVLINIIGKVL